MESVNKKVVALALVTALFTTFQTFMYIRRATTKPEVVEYVNIYVAARTLPARYQITDQDLKQVKVTKEFINGQAIQNKADIVGKRLEDRVIEGEQILKDRLVDESNLTLAYEIPEGKRAVSINVDEQLQVANLMNPGDYVDIIATFQKDEMEDKGSKYVLPALSKVIIQNVKVLAMGQEMETVDKKGKELSKTVTLAVTPQEAEKLVFSSEFGTLRLALRAVGDDKSVVTPGVIRNDAAPAKGLTILSK
jgi:pilus assembly protein CpaB